MYSSNKKIIIYFDTKLLNILHSMSICFYTRYHSQQCPINKYFLIFNDGECLKVLTDGSKITQKIEIFGNVTYGLKLCSIAVF